MTEEQIKQNAEEYALKKTLVSTDSFHGMVESYLAGAHSMLEEVKHLARIATIYKVDAQDTVAECERLHDIIDKLRNPWISVEEKLPENNCVVFVSLGGTEYLSAHYRAKSKRFVTVSKDKQTLIEVKRSSGTYTVCGDCIKEERLYSEGQREDITSLVTHWMSIPN